MSRADRFIETACVGCGEIFVTDELALIDGGLCSTCTREQNRTTERTDKMEPLFKQGQVLATAPPHDLSLEAQLAQKILAMEAACGYVQKDKQNQQQRYRYVSSEAILKKVSAAAVENGIASYPRYDVLADEVVEVGQNKTRMRMVTVRCVLHLVDSETGYSRTAEGLGSGSDTLDKAPMKAQTASHKYAWMGLLNISTGDDPEADDAAPRGRIHAVAPEDESQEIHGHNTVAEMEEALPDQPAPKPPLGLVASFAAVGVTKEQLEQYLTRDLNANTVIPPTERAILKAHLEALRTKQTTWDAVMAKATAV